jgi:hypothetical protein
MSERMHGSPVARALLKGGKTPQRNMPVSQNGLMKMAGLTWYTIGKLLTGEGGKLKLRPYVLPRHERGLSM